jgi:hypothetical protein
VRYSFARNGAVALTMAAVLVLSGCGQRPKSTRPATYPVRGTVTLNGEPLADAVVMFNSVAQSHGSVAITDSNGSYSLTTFVADDGVVPGDYTVAIIKEVPVAPKAGEPGSSPVAAPPDTKNILPKKYADGATSGFKATVVAGTNAAMDFAMEK